MSVNGTRLKFSYIDVATCGQVDGKNAARIRVNETGEITFFNQGGDSAQCKLENGFTNGSSCDAFDSKSLTSLTTGTTANTEIRMSSTLPMSMVPRSAMSTCACT